MVKKEAVIKNIFLFFMIFLLIADFASALLVVPASITMNFQPGYKQTFDYQVQGTKAGRVYALYTDGDLAQYATIDKKEIKGDGTFKVYLSLPKSLETPGYHKLYIGVKEQAGSEYTGSTIGTALELKVLVRVYVPYPGKYIESTIDTESVNLGKNVDFKMEIYNRGKDNVTITPVIEVFSNQTGQKVQTLNLESRPLATASQLTLHKLMNTSDYKPGRYSAVSIIEYGGVSPSIAYAYFRLGSLMINMTNWTKEIILENKIQKFDIEIENGWNDKIDGVYADVSFSNKTSEVISFKTSSTALEAWEEKTITGYFDTSNVSAGMHNANITLFYFGKDVGKSSSEIVQVEFKEKSNMTMIVLISLGAGILIMLVAIIIFLLIKRKPSRRR